MEGETSDEHTFTRKYQVVTLGTKSSVKINGEEVQVDPQLLFHRPIIVAHTPYEMESAFKHELCSYPPALFDSSLMLREAHKPALAVAIWVLFERPSRPMSQIKKVDVLDGGGTHSTTPMVSPIYIQVHRQPVH